MGEEGRDENEANIDGDGMRRKRRRDCDCEALAFVLCAPSHRASNFLMGDCAPPPRPLASAAALARWRAVTADAGTVSALGSVDLEAAQREGLLWCTAAEAAAACAARNTTERRKRGQRLTALRLSAALSE